MRLSALVLLAACGEAALPPPPPGPAAITATVAAKKVAEGAPVLLTLQVATAGGWSLPDPTLQADGLTVTPQGQATRRQVGDRQVVQQELALSGDPGSYVIDIAPLVATGPGDQTLDLDPQPLFVDIGVDGPSSEVADFEAPPPPEEPPWAWIAGGAAATLLAAGLALWAWRRQPEAPPPPPPPPDAALIAAWSAARAEHAAGARTDHDLAVALSALFREYLAAVLVFPAPSRTTREILSYVRHHGLLTDTERGRARNLLTATDRLKFAREGGGAEFFDALDEDLRAIVAATRPRRSDPVEPA